MLCKKIIFFVSLLMCAPILQARCSEKNEAVAKQRRFAKGVICSLSSLQSRIAIERASFVNACKTVLTLCVTKELSVCGTFNLKGTFILNGVDVTNVFEDSYGYFYLISPPDSVVVNGGDAFPFANDGLFSGVTRVPFTFTDFVLQNIGVYEVSWVLSIDEAAEIDLWLNGIEQFNTISGRPAGATQVSGCVLVETTVANTVLTLRNASGNAPVTVTDGTIFGSQPLVGSLVIKQVA